MKTRSAALALVLWAVTVNAQDRLTEEEVNAAVAAGLRRAAVPQSQCRSSSFSVSRYRLGFAITVRGPQGQIIRTASDATREYRPFSPADVTDDLRQRLLYVAALPFAPSVSGGSWTFSPLAERIVLKKKDSTGDNPADVLQPLSTEHLERSWSNAMGGKFEGRGMMATFDFDAFQKIPGEVDVVVISNHGERRCKIGLKDKQALR